MGTRNLTCIYADGEYRVAQYGQWDGYPSAAGVDILEFLRDADLDVLKQKALACTEIDDEEHKSMWIECGASPDSDWVSVDISHRFKEKHPHLHRDMGYGIVRYVYENAPLQVDKALDFASDGLFCEYAYVVDLDQNTFEVYIGGEYLKPGQHLFDQKGCDVGLMERFSLLHLPSNDEFLQTLREEE
jgi:hypothetical protein